MYDENEFKGVTCTDINLILDLTTLENKSDYSSTFTPALQTANSACTTFDFAALGIDIEALRAKMGGLVCEDESKSNNGWYIFLIILVVIVLIILLIVLV